MSSLINDIPLANGLVARLADLTHHYYGGFYRVVLEISCEVTPAAAHFSCHEEFSDAKKILGSTVTYRRRIEQMGVPADQVENVRNKLAKAFTDHSLSYLAGDQFEKKMVAYELIKVKKRRSLPSSYVRNDG